MEQPGTRSTKRGVCGKIENRRFDTNFVKFRKSTVFSIVRRKKDPIDALVFVIETTVEYRNFLLRKITQRILSSVVKIVETVRSIATCTVNEWRYLVAANYDDRER